MIIKSSISIAKVNLKAIPKLKKFVSDDEHHISATGDIAKALGLGLDSSVKILPGVTLSPLPVEVNKFTAEQKLKIQDAVVTFGSATLPLLKKYHPALTGSADGIEFVFATKKAIDAFTDNEDKSFIKPTVKTVRALMELIDVLKPAFPQIQNIPYLETIGVIIKVGDSAWQIYSDVSKATSSGIVK